MTDIHALQAFIRNHRCFSHPIFDHWARTDPAPSVVAALFHQIQMFCASTRPGGSMPQALEELGMAAQRDRLLEIVASEENHGPELATMAAYLVNRKASTVVFDDIHDTAEVENGLKLLSDGVLGRLPGYDHASGLTTQTRNAIAVMRRRERTDRETTLRNLGTTVALEMISNRHLIPGEKRCLVDSGIYGVSLEEPEMHYLLEHWGECGAEEQHEQHALEAVAEILDAETAPLVHEGARDFLDSLAALWDVLDASLLQSGQAAQTAPSAVATS